MRLAIEQQGSGPAVVLLHGFPLDRTMWANQLGALSDRHRVVAPDLRGHGQSPSPPGPYPMEDLAADVVETLDALGVEPPYVVGGLSMGGYVALALADRFPDRLLGLMLLNTRAGADSPEVARNREATAQAIEREGSTSPLSGMVDKLFAPAHRRSRPDLVDQVAEVIRRTPPEGAAGALRGMAMRPDRLGVIRSLRVPVLVIAGAEDAIVPEAESRAMADAAADGELIVIPGAGHLSPMEAPGETAAAVQSFLARLP
ncbi:alpha/beta fold hydrolase [Tautonia sociabilis]|uniref:Alpha/beta fold hydrolase n=1 Tax=Tautonia sociabilis TaxID=2080755 RepID=A0A432MR88_9BACT|nr:alpha/beta fold hydrolase [Tautonia sociabilis]RUL89769.1 alpha/beta fold hydrolase [Tautonia sociabilis]